MNICSSASVQGFSFNQFSNIFVKSYIVFSSSCQYCTSNKGSKAVSKAVSTTPWDSRIYFMIGDEKIWPGPVANNNLLDQNGRFVIKFGTGMRSVLFF